MSHHICKAKSKLSGNWAKGYYVKIEDKETGEELHLIIEPSGTIEKYGYDTNDYEIDPETLCRCTGIPYGDDFLWENDILWDDLYEENATIEWSDGSFWLMYQGVVKDADLGSAALYLRRVGNEFDGIEECEQNDRTRKICD